MEIQRLIFDDDCIVRERAGRLRNVHGEVDYVPVIRANHSDLIVPRFFYWRYTEFRLSIEKTLLPLCALH